MQYGMVKTSRRQDLYFGDSKILVHVLKFRGDDLRVTDSVLAVLVHLRI